MTDLFVVDGTLPSKNPRWAGGAQRAMDKNYLATYERMTDLTMQWGFPVAFVRESADWDSDYGEEIDLSSVTAEDAYDPTFMRIGSDIYVVWTGWDKVWCS